MRSPISSPRRAFDRLLSPGIRGAASLLGGNCPNSDRRGTLIARGLTEVPPCRAPCAHQDRWSRPLPRGAALGKSCRGAGLQPRLMPSNIARGDLVRVLRRNCATIASGTLAPDALAACDGPRRMRRECGFRRREVAATDTLRQGPAEHWARPRTCLEGAEEPMNRGQSLEASRTARCLRPSATRSRSGRTGCGIISRPDRLIRCGGLARQGDAPASFSGGAAPKSSAAWLIAWE